MNKLGNMLSIGAVILMNAVIAGYLPAAESYDWPYFRGPSHDGISKETAWNPRALANGPVVKWKASLGEGWSSVSIYGDKLFTMGNINRLNHASPAARDFRDVAGTDQARLGG